VMAVQCKCSRQLVQRMKNSADQISISVSSVATGTYQFVFTSPPLHDISFYGTMCAILIEKITKF